MLAFTAQVALGKCVNRNFARWRFTESRQEKLMYVVYPLGR